MLKVLQLNGLRYSRSISQSLSVIKEQGVSYKVKQSEPKTLPLVKAMSVPTLLSSLPNATATGWSLRLSLMAAEVNLAAERLVLVTRPPNMWRTSSHSLANL